MPLSQVYVCAQHKSQDFMHMLHIIRYSLESYSNIVHEQYTKNLDFSKVTRDHFVRVLKKCAK